MIAATIDRFPQSWTQTVFGEFIECDCKSKNTLSVSRLLLTVCFTRLTANIRGFVQFCFQNVTFYLYNLENKSIK